MSASPQDILADVQARIDKVLAPAREAAEAARRGAEQVELLNLPRPGDRE